MDLKTWLKPSLNWLAVFIPIAFAMAFIPPLHNPTVLFVVSCLSMVVVSAWIGNATEKLAVVVGPTWGGMLNAAFGNLPELIFGLIALTKGLGPLVKAAWTGAILGNLLLVLGSAMLFGGLRNGRQSFPVGRANDASTSLLLAVFALLMPAVYIKAFPEPSDSIRLGVDDISIGMGILLLIAYAASIVHTFLEARTSGATGAVEAAEIRHHDERPNVKLASLTLAGASVLIALLSDFVSDSVDSVKEQFGLSDLFLGVIVIAAIGNVAAQISAISMALKNKMDLSFEIGMSAGTQVALLVVPFLVLMSYVFGKPVDLEFTGAEIISLGAAAMITTQIAQDGSSNWLNGLQMLVLYAMVAVLFFFVPG
ncbi:MAG: calcium/proton exchanger [Pirellulales bacterium]